MTTPSTSESKSPESVDEVSARLLRKGLESHQAGDLHVAKEAYQAVLAQDPDNPDALHLLGIVARRSGNPSTAVVLIGRAVALRPTLPECQFNLGNALIDLGRFEEAAGCYRRALQLKPTYHEASYQLANCLVALQHPVEAEEAFRRALEIHPAYAEAHHNLANLMRHRGRTGMALTHYRAALQASPMLAEGHYNLGHCLLQLGHFKEGLACYEWRWRTASFTPRRCLQPLWDGTPFPGRTLLIDAEQGLGDTLLFLRYIPLARALGGSVTFVCQPALHRLVSGMPGIGHVIPAGSDLPPFDLHIPLMSLPHRMGTTIETIPAPVPRLPVDSDLQKQWAGRLDRGGPGMRIGLAWQGNPKASIDRTRSIPLACLAPLGRIQGIRLISLQKEYGREQIAELPGDVRIEDLGPELDSGPDAFLDTAAVIANLDLVISCDTAITHVAAALGRPVWLLLCTVPDWRWQLGRDDSPWYPTVRLFRQRRHGDWEDVVADVATALGGRNQILAAVPPRFQPEAALVQQGR